MGKTVDFRPRFCYLSPARLEKLFFRTDLPPRHVVTMKGMDRKEMADFLNKRPFSDYAGMDYSRVIDYSLGVPSLAESIGGFSSTKEGAVAMAAGYLQSCFSAGQLSDIVANRREWSRYFCVNLPRDLKRMIMTNPETPRMSAQIPWLVKDVPALIERKHQTERKFNCVEEPISFVAPESMEIYRRGLEQGPSIPYMSVWVPELNEAEYDAAGRAFGFDVDGEGLSEHDKTWLHRIFSRGSRTWLFGTSFSKNSLYFVNPTGGRDWVFLHGDVPALSRIAASQKAFSDGELALQTRGQLKIEGSNGMLLLTCGRHIERDYEVVQFGVAVETWLQQKQIPYFVREWDGNDYCFDPSTKRLVRSDNGDIAPNLQI